jgi:tryptophan synthase alpha chain
MSNYVVMVHMIPYYPDYARSLAVAKGILAGGAQHIEIQFPFSDPSADGPAIERACNIALTQGFTVDKGFEFVKQVRSMVTEQEIHIMTYASIPVRRGIDRYCKDVAQSGAVSVILPDIPLDQDEGLLEATRTHHINLIPVVVPTTTESRLDLILAHEPSYVYCALRTGITGTKTELGQANLDFLDRVRRRTQGYGGRLLGGFGIQEPNQVAALAPHVYGVVVGSALVKLIQDSMDLSLEGLEQRVAKFVASLVG